MIRLYTHEAACRFQRRATASLGLSLGLMGTALAVCIFLCTRLTTANAQTLLFTTIALFTLAGWAAMLVLYFVYGPARTQASHMLGMLSAQEESYEGTQADPGYLPHSKEHHRVQGLHEHPGRQYFPQHQRRSGPAAAPGEKAAGVGGAQVHHCL